MHVYVCACVSALTPPIPALPSDPALHKERAGGKENAWGKPGRRTTMRARNTPGSGGDGQSPQGLLLPAGKILHVVEEGSSGAGRGPGAASRGHPAVSAMADPLHPALVRPHLPPQRPSRCLPSARHTAPAPAAAAQPPPSIVARRTGKDEPLRSPLRRPGARGCPRAAGQVQAGGGTAWAAGTAG